MIPLRPPIQPGNPLTPTKRPFLGWRVNYLIALYNAMVNLKVKVVSQVGTSGGSSSALNNIQPGLSFDANNNGVLTIPINQAAQQTTQGWFWTAGQHNYDPTRAYADMQVVYVRASSSVVTTGVTDPDSGLPVKSLPGLWVALRAVGASSNHIPHLPMPTPDDMDAANNYWAFVSPIPLCI